jgi:hypothetical protein
MSWRTILLGSFLLVLLLLGTKSESLWIDEGDTAYYAVQPNFNAWMAHLLCDRNADCQFPLSMLAAWAWEKLTGPSEFALRTLNAGFALIALASMSLIGRLLGLRCLWVLLLIQPFFWFYLNEARPYMLQIASGSVLLAGFVTLRVKKGIGYGWPLFLTGSILLYYSTLLSFVTLGVFYAAVLFLVFRKDIALPKKWGWWLLLMGLVIAPGGVYYLHTVLRGVEGAKIWNVGPLNLLWIYDEIIGGLGLGPPVWQIRETARSLIHSRISLSTVTPFVLPAILALGIAWAFFVAAWNTIRKPGLGSIYPILAAVVASIVFLFAVLAVVLKKAFWARHLSPVFPVYVLLLYGALHFLVIKRYHTYHRILGLLLVALLAYSSFQVIHSERYSKDDYRGAAARALATIQAGGNVWWAGSWHCGAYYGLPISEGISNSLHLILAHDLIGEKLISHPSPKIIILSRPDIYDNSGSLQEWLKSHGYLLSDKLQSFSVYSRPE